VILAPLEWHSSVRDRIAELPPVYIFPEAAAKALDALYTYASRRSRPEGKFLEVEADRDAVDALLDAKHADEGGYLPPNHVFEALAHYGIPLAGWAWVDEVEAACAEAKRVGYPVVAKLGGRGIVHKSELNAVRIGIESEDELRAALTEMRSDLARLDPDAVFEGFLIQEMVAGEREVFMGMRHDPSYGDLMVFGMGGKYVEVLKDTFMRLAPITDLDTKVMIEGIKGIQLLEGVRGEPPSRIDILRETLQRLSAFITAHDQVIEMDVNPFMAGSTAETCKLVDARIRVRT
jgi:hypothetical protein